jgi:hypothetical protein
LRGCEDVVVSGNQCNDNAQANIWAEASQSTTLDRILISGNSCYKAVGASKGNILVQSTGPAPYGVIGTVDIIGNKCDGGGVTAYGIGILDIGSGVNIIDNVSLNHAGGANLSLVAGCYIRHSGPGAAASQTSSAVKGSLWMRTDGNAADAPMQIFHDSGWCDVEDNIVTVSYTASTSHSQGNGVLKRGVSEISVVANTDDTVTLPTAVAGIKCTIINNGANTLRIYPSASDNFSDSIANAFYPSGLAPGTNITFLAYNATTWEVV